MISSIEKRTTLAGLLGIFLAAPLVAQIAVTPTSLNFSESFGALPASGSDLSWNNNTTIEGWFRDYAGTNPPPGRDVSLQGSNTGQTGFFNIGPDGSDDRAIGMRLASFVPEGAWGAVFENASGSAITEFAVGYTGEQWRRQKAAVGSLYFEYALLPDFDALSFSVLTAETPWTRLDALQFDSPNVVGGASGLDGRLAGNRQVFAPVTIPAAIDEGSYLALRWYYNDTTSSHALAINDVSVNFAPVPEPSTYAVGLGALALLVGCLKRLRNKRN